MEKRRPMRRMDGPVRRRVVRRPATGSAATPPQPVFVTGRPQVAADDAVTVRSGAPSQSRRRLRVSRKWAALTASLVFVAVVGVVGIKAVLASQRVMTKNVTGGAPVLKGDIDPTKLKGEGDGRINILLLGTGGGGHDGGNLSDTIMVASIDPINKNVAMLSIPRDLYVKIPGYGYGKINSANAAGGPELAKQVVSSILDLPIHYYAQIDFSGFKQAINAVGGVDIDVPHALYDPAYPCENSYKYCVYRQPTGYTHMDGVMALRYARCRHDDPAGSGANCGNDFGRAARQQAVLAALREKALQASTLTNPVKISGLIDSVGDHVRTDFQLKELQKLGKIIKDVDVSKATNAVLDEKSTKLVVDGGGRYPGAGSILLPAAGDFDYTAIQELAHSIFIDGYIKKEGAQVGVQNGTARAGLAAAVATQLTAYGYSVADVSTAAEQTHRTSTVIDYTNGNKPYTVKYLENRFHTMAVRQAHPLDANRHPTGPDIGIIVGSDYTMSAQAPLSSSATGVVTERQ